MPWKGKSIPDRRSLKIPGGVLPRCCGHSQTGRSGEIVIAALMFKQPLPIQQPLTL